MRVCIRPQPRSQSSLTISDMTSPVKLVGKIRGKIRYRARFQASSGHSDSANRPGYEVDQAQLLAVAARENV